ncbi:MAG TPA: hemerythrin domain-containing protein [Acidimicrobiales bacterium]|nr:hemerythrin domain-containing protein [Acidimicrobiales bacterium]
MATPATLSATQLLRQRHREIEDMFQRTLAAAGDERRELFECLRATLAVHETTEEMFVHPLARRLGDRAERIVEARLAEERDATKTLKELEDLGPEGDQFATRLTRFQRAVHEHAEAEEHELFPIVDAECSHEDLSHLADAILAGEQLAPTHPHPHAGQNPIALMLVGPFAAMVDKTRDHFTQWQRSRATRN